MSAMNQVNWMMRELEDSARIKLLYAHAEGIRIARSADLMAKALKAGRKVVVFGNGGSAADAQHLAGELVGRFVKERRALPAIALTTDTSILTAVANDYSYEEVFSRQIEGLVQRGDVAIGITTSGNSANVIRGLAKARQKKAVTIAWTGETGGKVKKVAHLTLCVPSKNTQRIQECHLATIHLVCGLVEGALFPR